MGYNLFIFITKTRNEMIAYDYTNQEHYDDVHMDLLNTATTEIWAVTDAVNNSTLLQTMTVTRGDVVFGVNATLTYANDTFTANFIDRENTPPSFNETYVIPTDTSSSDTGYYTEVWRSDGETF